VLHHGVRADYKALAVEAWMDDVSSSEPPAIVWFRDDLRLADNPALHAAAALKQPLLFVYVHDETVEGARVPGGAAKWWLHGSLAALDAALRTRGGELVILRGSAAQLIERLAVGAHASAVFWNRRYDAPGRAVDTAVKSALKAHAIAAESSNGYLLHEPWTVMNKTGAPFRMFSAYWRAACAGGTPSKALPVPKLPPFHKGALPVGRVEPDALHLEPRDPDWAGGMREVWTRSEKGAQARLDDFIADGLKGYAAARDRPDKPGTSRLSPYLRFGNISSRQIWHAVKAAEAARHASSTDCEKFLSELGWREFSYHLLYHQPDLAVRNVQAQFDAMPWRNDPAALRAWQHGKTGYPIVDAGMRELWTTG
jgi:deoxyribodipyrimidine photo-lyase